jgi:hypothetical protein
MLLAPARPLARWAFDRRLANARGVAPRRPGWVRRVASWDPPLHAELGAMERVDALLRRVDAQPPEAVNPRIGHAAAWRGWAGALTAQGITVALAVLLCATVWIIGGTPTPDGSSPELGRHSDERIAGDTGPDPVGGVIVDVAARPTTRSRALPEALAFPIAWHLERTLPRSDDRDEVYLAQDTGGLVRVGAALRPWPAPVDRPLAQLVHRIAARPRVTAPVITPPTPIDGESP